MLVRLLLLILLLPFPLYPADAPAAFAPAPSIKPAAAVVPASTATPAPVFTDAEWQRGQATAPQEGSGVVGKAAVGLLLSLVAIAAVAAGLAYAVRKLGMRRVLPGRGHHLKVIETVQVGFKRAVSLVRIGDQVLVVGLGEHEVSHLATLPASVLDEPAPRPVEPVGSMQESAPTTPPILPASAFRAVLDTIVGPRA